MIDINPFDLTTRCMKPPTYIKSSVASISFTLATIAFSIHSLHAAITLGTDDIFSSSSAPPISAPPDGNLIISGDVSVYKGLDIGTTQNGSSPPISAIQIDWTETPKTASFDLSKINSNFIWRDNLSGTARAKMKLDANNVLSLYNTTGTTATITLNPSSGIITSSGSPVLTQASAASGGFLNSNQVSVHMSGGTVYGQAGENTTALSGGTVFQGENVTALSGAAANANSATAMSGAEASGEFSTAMSSAVTYGFRSTAMSYATAYGESSTAMSYATANGESSTAMSNATAIGDYSTAMSYGTTYGYGSTAMSGGIGGGNASTAMSSGNANGDNSTAMSGGSSNGYNSTAMSSGTSNGDNSTAMSNGITLGPYSTAMGYGVSSGEFSLASGYFSQALAFTSSAFGSFSYSWGSPDIWVETDPILIVGNGNPEEDGMEVSNAITTLKNGQTTLTNKAWKANPTSPLADPPATTTDSGGEALVVEGHTRLKGKVIIEQAQGDISMGFYN